MKRSMHWLVALFMGPRQTGWSGLDVEDLTEAEARSRRPIAQHLDYFSAHAPGFENAYMMFSAPQIGVRHTRRLAGVARITRTRGRPPRCWPTKWA